MSNSDAFFEAQNLKKFVGRTGNEFVSALPQPYVDTYPIDEPPGKLIGFALQFSDGWVVDLYAKDLKFVKKFSENMDWKVQDFLRETITDISAKRFPPKP